MKRIYKLIIPALIVLLLFSSCSFKKDLSGSYDIDTFLELLKPAREAAEKAVEYATEEEEEELYSKKYQEGLKQIGFTGKEHIVLNGKFDCIVSTSEKAILVVTNKDDTDFVSVKGSFNSIGWVGLLKGVSNIKISFDVVSDSNNQLSFINCEIVSPSKIEYKANCNPSLDDKVVMGKVAKVYTIDQSKEEIAEAAMDATSRSISESMWYSAMEWANKYIVIKDDSGNEMGVFVNEDKNPTKIRVGNKIGCFGKVHEVKMTGYPDKYMDSSTLLTGGCYYIFTD